MSKFELGMVVTTRGISDAMEENQQFADDVMDAFARYQRADFSDMKYKDDIQKNLDSINGLNDYRILAEYDTCEGEIWIITEWDRSVTTILFPSEY